MDWRNGRLCFTCGDDALPQFLAELVCNVLVLRTPDQVEHLRRIASDGIQREILIIPAEFRVAIVHRWVKCAVAPVSGANAATADRLADLEVRRRIPSHARLRVQRQRPKWFAAHAWGWLDACAVQQRWRQVQQRHHLVDYRRLVKTRTRNHKWHADRRLVRRTLILTEI